jgi:hypothetical protein
MSGIPHANPQSRFFLALVLMALGAALLITAAPRDEQLTANVLIGRHSTTPARVSASSRATRSVTAAAAQDSISSFVMALSFAPANLSTPLN